jgi:hypothetical protein
MLLITRDNYSYWELTNKKQVNATLVTTIKRIEGVQAMQILITGSAGFVGFHLSSLLLQNKSQVIGLDNLNDYYDPELKNSQTRNLK